MALDDLSFKMYTDSGLTTPFSGLYQLIHESDLSDNPQDFQLWFGSTEASRTLEASSNPGVDQVTITPTDILEAWVASTAYTTADSVQPTVANGNRYSFGMFHCMLHARFRLEGLSCVQSCTITLLEGTRLVPIFVACLGILIVCRGISAV